MVESPTPSEIPLTPVASTYPERMEPGLSRKTWLAFAGVAWVAVLGFLSL
ncbi:MAG: hypothetical protein NXH85_10260 [Pseudomonadaceae bacterium]|nr:hypothetical protein [Pseudomonadaceae bacterium]